MLSDKLSESEILEHIRAGRGTPEMFRQLELLYLEYRWGLQVQDTLASPYNYSMENVVFDLVRLFAAQKQQIRQIAPDACCANCGHYKSFEEGKHREHKTPIGCSLEHYSRDLAEIRMANACARLPHSVCMKHTAITRPKICDDCGGTGKCKACGGLGVTQEKKLG